MSILDRFRLDGRVAIVTGASSGLGVAFAKALAEAGADVVLAARRVERLDDTARLVEEAGCRALCVRADVSSPEDCRSVARAAAGFGTVGVLVNNAGVAEAVPASRERPEEFRGVLDVNLFGAYWMAQAAAAVMPRGGSIVNVSSVLGLVSTGLPQAAYASSKAGLLGLTRDLAAQWSSRKDIRVNALAPGYFASEMTARQEPGYVDDIVRRIPIPRTGHPEELAAALLFLASDASGYVTGSTLTVDGGLTIS
ncbi:SDR family NAD(P)-dependent oxidoreductase [Streptomyces sp. NPDC017979]|uniref:SDR family NAD(P)-dependent oxidoreductase n=1 Tax=Streptomyces sp. NPDC017979 TaxID=3365024 RepID=UPI00379234BD